MNDIRFTQIVNTEQFVDQYYEMDPGTEELLYSGAELEDGMVVLLELPSNKMYIAQEMTPAEYYKARETNQWCTVFKLQRKGDNVGFIGVYPDGVKRTRIYPLSTSWLVKKFSMRDENAADQYTIPSDRPAHD